MLALVVVLFYFTIFAFIVTHRGTRNWDRIRSCLQDFKVCRSLQNKNETITHLSQVNLKCYHVTGYYFSNIKTHLVIYLYYFYKLN
jgi:hypothetical protein